MMSPRWMTAAFLLATQAALPTSRAEGQTLTLRNAAEQALARYPEVLAAAASREAATAGRGKAQAARWPSLQLSSSVTAYEEPMLVTPLRGFDPQSAPSFDRTLVHGTVTAAYTLFDGGEAGARVRFARALEEVASASLESITRSVLHAVVVEYVSVLAAAEVFAAHELRVQALRAESDAVLARIEAGGAPRVEALRAQAELDRAEAERTRVATELEVAQGNLARLIGAEDAVSVSGVRPVQVTDEALPPREELLESALSANPDLQRARREAAVADAALRVARSGLWPRLELIGRFDNRGAPGEDFQGEWSVGGRVSMPLFDGGSRSSEVSRARAEGEAANERVRLTELRLREQLDRALASVRDAEARTGSLRSAVRQWEEVARAVRVARDAGAGTQADYLDAQASLVSARSSLAEVRMKAIIARAEVARLTGTLSLEWLDANLEDGA